MKLETIEEAILDIRKLLIAKAYGNKEEPIRLSLVARVLSALNWNIWNPQEVHAESEVGRDQAGRADICLFYTNEPRQIIEIKKHGALKKEKGVESPESQLDDYVKWWNKYPVGIVTDGDRWIFYWWKAPGDPKDRVCADLTLTHTPLEECCAVFNAILGRDQNGSNLRFAKNAEKFFQKHYDAKLQKKREESIQAIVREVCSYIREEDTIYRKHRLKQLLVDRLGISPKKKGLDRDMDEYLVKYSNQGVQLNKSTVFLEVGLTERQPRQPLKRPAGVLLLGEERAARNWPEVVQTVAEILWTQRERDFQTIVKEIKLIKLTSEVADQTCWLPISNSGYLISPYRDASNAIRQINKLLENFGIESSECQIKERQ